MLKTGRSIYHVMSSPRIDLLWMCPAPVLGPSAAFLHSFSCLFFLNQNWIFIRKVTIILKWHINEKPPSRNATIKHHLPEMPQQWRTTFQKRASNLHGKAHSSSQGTAIWECLHESVNEFFWRLMLYLETDVAERRITAYVDT